MNNELINYSEYGNDGNEHLTSSDFQIPYIKILERMSPTLAELEEAGIEAKAGDLYISSKDDVVKQLLFIPLHYIKTWSVWDKISNNKLYGSFKTKDEASHYIESEDISISAEIIETGQNTILLLNEDMEIEHPTMLYLSKTRLKVNKDLNTKIQIAHPKGSPRYSGIWSLETKNRKIEKGNWYVPKFTFNSLCNKSLFEEASMYYKSIVKTLAEDTFQIYHQD